MTCRHHCSVAIYCKTDDILFVLEKDLLLLGVDVHPNCHAGCREEDASFFTKFSLISDFIVQVRTANAENMMYFCIFLGLFVVFSGIRLEIMRRENLPLKVFSTSGLFSLYFLNCELIFSIALLFFLFPFQHIGI